MKAIGNNDNGLWQYLVLTYAYPDGDNPDKEIKKFYTSFWDFNEAKGFADNKVLEERCWVCVIDIQNAFGKVYETCTSAKLAGVDYFFPIPEYQYLVENVTEFIANEVVARYGTNPLPAHIGSIGAEVAARVKGIPRDVAKAIGQDYLTAHPVFVDDFDTPSLNPQWLAVDGNWISENGVVKQTKKDFSDPTKLLIRDITPSTNIEVFVCMRIDGWEKDGRGRAGLSLGNERSGLGYNFVFCEDQKIVAFLNDHVAWGTRYAFDWEIGQWYKLRMTQKPNGLFAKVWKDTAQEPATWQFSQTYWPVKTGLIGLNGGALVSFDKFSIIAT